MRISPVDRAKADQGFEPAMWRTACRNCLHVSEVAPTGAVNDCWRLRCSVGGFGVTAWSCCNRHQPKPKPQAGGI